MKTSQEVEDDIKSILIDLYDLEVKWENFIPICTLTIKLGTYLKAWELARYVEQEVGND